MSFCWADDVCDENTCILILQTIVAELRTNGWPHADAKHVRVPQIEDTYLSFALGEGDI